MGFAGDTSVGRLQGHEGRPRRRSATSTMQKGQSVSVHGPVQQPLRTIRRATKAAVIRSMYKLALRRSAALLLGLSVTACGNGEPETTNTPPEVLAVTVTPEAPQRGDTLTCDATTYDADGDAVTVAYAWSINGSDTGITGVVADLDLARGDEVTCTAVPADGTDEGVGGVATVTVGNTPPEVLTVTVTPKAPKRDDTLTCDATTYDADGDAVTIAYAWSINGIDTGVTGAVADLDTARGDEVTCTAEANDGIDTATASSSVWVDTLAFFAASDSETGPELWVTDGTRAGTALLAEINQNPPGDFDWDACLEANPAQYCEEIEEYCDQDIDHGYCGHDGGSAPSDFIALGDWVYFVASDGIHGRELWRTDGETVERLTNINTSGDSFEEDTFRLVNRARQITVHDEVLYLRARDAHGSYGVYRYTDEDGPVRISDVDDVEEVKQDSWSAFASVGSTLFWAVTRSAGNDIYAYDGSGPPYSIGANHVHGGLRATSRGLVFRGYRSSYWSYVYTASASHPEVYETTIGSLGEIGVFQDEVCGSTGGKFTCFDGTEPPDGVRQLDPEGVGSTSGMAIIDESLLCFRGHLSTYMVLCTDPTGPLFSLPDQPDGGDLAAHQGDLYFTCFSTGGLCHWSPGSDAVSEVDSPGGRPRFTASVAGTPYLLYNAPPPGETVRSLRIYDTAGASVDQVPEARDPHRFFPWQP
jgi:ELWxxDGT repeat protein